MLLVSELYLGLRLKVFFRISTCWVELLIFRITVGGVVVIPTMMNSVHNKKTAFVAVLSFFLSMGATTFVVADRWIGIGVQRGTILNRNWR